MQIFSQLGSEMQIFLVTIFALICGSFVSLLTYRIPNDQPIGLTRSKCINCGAALRFFNLIPLFSFIFQRGKCSNCHAKISLRYIIIELSFLLAFLTIYFALDQEFSAKMLLYFFIASTLILMSVIDIEHYYIPDSAQYFLSVLAIILFVIQKDEVSAIEVIKSGFLYTFFGLALYAFFYFTAKIEALGIDDIKFFAISGLMLGMNSFLFFMMLCGAFGLIFGAIWTKIKKEETFPFAPALCLALFICLLFDKKINVIDLIGSMLFFQF